MDASAGEDQWLGHPGRPRIMLDVIPSEGWRTALAYADLLRVEYRSKDELGLLFRDEVQVTVRGDRLDAVYEAALTHSLRTLRVQEKNQGGEEPHVREVWIQ